MATVGMASNNLVVSGAAPEVAVTVPRVTTIESLSLPNNNIAPVITQDVALWTGLQNEYHSMLERQGCQDVLAIRNFAQFEASMNVLCTQYSRRTLPRIIEKLYPSLDHLRSFSQAIASCTQTNDAAALVWGATQAVVQVACRYAEHLENIIGFLSSFNKSLPMFDEYLDMFPHKPTIRWPLKDMYMVYLRYCVTAVKHLKTNPLVSLLKFALPTSQPKILANAKAQLEVHRRKFLEEVEILHRQEVRDNERHTRVAHNAILQDLEDRQRLERERNSDISGMTSRALTPATSSASSTSELIFPVTNFHEFPNLNFAGRVDILREVHANLQGSELDNSPITGPACVTLQGMGGMGKTQTAQQYIHTHKGDYDAVFWLRAEEQGVLLNSYCEIASKLKMVFSSSQNAVDMAREWLEGTNKKWLLVFDNTEEFHDLKFYWPTNLKSRGCIIITSQKSMDAVPGPHKEIAVTSMTEKEGSELLYNHLKREPRDENERKISYRISQEIGGLPLAIVTIGGFVRKSSCTLQEFMESLNSSDDVWESSGFGALKPYEKNLMSVFGMALDELSEEAEALINVLAFLNPDAIPEDLLGGLDDQGTLSFLNFPRGERYLRIVGDLDQRQLVKRSSYEDGKRYLSIHRSLQWSILHKLNKVPERRKAAFHQAFSIIRALVPVAPYIETVIKPDLLPRYKTALPQLMSLSEHAKKPIPELHLNQEFATLLCDLGTYLWQQMLADECKSTLEMAEDIFNKIDFDQDSPLRSNINCQLGILSQLYGISQLEESTRRRKAMADVRERLMKKSPHPTTQDEIYYWGALADLAYGYLCYGKLDESYEIMKKCHPLYHKWGLETEYPFEHAKWWRHSGYMHLKWGDVEGGIKSSQHAIDLQTLASGKDGSLVLMYQFDKGQLLYAGGKREAALDLNLEILRRRIQICGETSHFTLESHAYTGALLYDRGNLDDAEKVLRKCLLLADRAQWSLDHVARAQFYLSKTLRKKYRIGQNAKIDDEARLLEDACASHKDECLRRFPAQLVDDPGDDRVVYDQMVPIFSGRLTGELVQQR